MDADPRSIIPVIHYEDLAFLSQEDFDEFWASIGRILRDRSLRELRKPEPIEQEGKE